MISINLAALKSTFFITYTISTLLLFHMVTTPELSQLTFALFMAFLTIPICEAICAQQKHNRLLTLFVAPILILYGVVLGIFGIASLISVPLKSNFAEINSFVFTMFSPLGLCVVIVMTPIVITAEYLDKNENTRTERFEQLPMRAIIYLVTCFAIFCGISVIPQHT